MTPITGPFLRFRAAAEYCGYTEHTFRRIMQDFDVPKHGPARTRFAQSVLDAFMENPDAFRKDTRTRRRKPRLVTV